MSAQVRLAAAPPCKCRTPGRWRLRHSSDFSIRTKGHSGGALVTLLLYPLEPAVRVYCRCAAPRCPMLRLGDDNAALRPEAVAANRDSTGGPPDRAHAPPCRRFPDRQSRPTPRGSWLRPRGGLARRPEGRCLATDGAPAPTDADDRFDDSRYLPRTLASNGRSSGAFWRIRHREPRIGARLSGPRRKQGWRDGVADSRFA